MKQISIPAVCIAICLWATLISCTQPAANTASAASIGPADAAAKDPVKWGEHLVNIGGCNDCHTPKKMGPHGPENDSSLLLSGHPSLQPIADIDRKMAEAKGLAVSNTETAWIGPWGVTFAANLTPDSTGIASWTEDQFIKCVKQNKWMGMDNSRPLLPPMPVTSLINMTDDEVKAIFAYLKSLKPIHNIVPAYMPPVTAMKK